MASKVEIANRALTKLGQARITSFSDDSKAARAVSAIWDTLRDAELRARRWSFAIKRDSIAALSSTPSWGFDYEYQLPSDFLALIEIDEGYDVANLNDYIGTPAAPYSIEAGKILTDLEAPLDIRYAYRVTDTAQWDATFVEAFACRLAMELAEDMTQSNSKRQLAFDEYREAIRAAVRANAIERPPVALPDDSWMLSRL